MNRTEYKNNFSKEHYERINLAVPKGMKEIIKSLAADKGMSVNAYLQDLVRQDQCGMFDTMQIAEKNREMISGITGIYHPKVARYQLRHTQKPFYCVIS